MTMFQETYDQVLYARLHLYGPKRNFAFRLDAPHRAAEAGMRGITMGVLLGLGDWRSDVFMVGMHGQWLQRLFPQLELAFSLPRIQPRSEKETRNDAGTDEGRSIFEPRIVTDREFVQAMAALRCFMPHAGFTLSTRERAFFRDKLLEIGVTKLSAGVSTSVGGYVQPQKATTCAEAIVRGENETTEDAVQFVIDDERSVSQMATDLERLGFQPVFADWLLPKDGDMPLAEALRRSLGVAGDTPGVDVSDRPGIA
jgi:2-iminoacetate synthase